MLFSVCSAIARSTCSASPARETMSGAALWRVRARQVPFQQPGLLRLTDSGEHTLYGRCCRLTCMSGCAPAAECLVPGV